MLYDSGQGTSKVVVKNCGFFLNEGDEEAFVTTTPDLARSDPVVVDKG